jgi:hypothetical protein
MKPESRTLAALAYNDAVRDILRADGVFHLGDDESRDAVWEWDGVSWKRIPLVDHPVDVEPAREEELAIR